MTDVILLYKACYATCTEAFFAKHHGRRLASPFRGLLSSVPLPLTPEGILTLSIFSRVKSKREREREKPERLSLLARTEKGEKARFFSRLNTQLTINWVHYGANIEKLNNI